MPVIFFESHLIKRNFYLEEVSEAFIPAGDEFLLSLCINNFSRVYKQAYFTRDLDINNDNITSMSLRIAEASDKELIEKYTSDFFEELDDSNQVIIVIVDCLDLSFRN